MEKIAAHLKRQCSQLSAFQAIYGWRTLLLLFLVYWGQGFKQFGSLAITFYYKDVL